MAMVIASAKKFIVTEYYRLIYLFFLENNKIELVRGKFRETLAKIILYSKDNFYLGYELYNLLELGY